MSDVTWTLQPIAGGALIGVSASLLHFVSGHRAGISGIVAGATVQPASDAAWRARFLIGLLAAGAVAAATASDAVAAPTDRPLAIVTLAGLFVGFGTRLAGGCTSGHGVCGLSRRSPASLAAVATFMASAMVTVFVAERVLGVDR
jgi:uncharacterized membrane protein YedE/YeeE